MRPGERMQIDSKGHRDMADPPVHLFPGRDGLELAYHEIRDGRPLSCSTGSRPPRCDGSTTVPRPPSPRMATPSSSRICAATVSGVDKDVGFVDETDDDINNQIDDTYRTKYRRYGARYVNPMVSLEARAATIKLLPAKKVSFRNAS
jgi:hypothetical protein